MDSTHAIQLIKNKFYNSIKIGEGTYGEVYIHNINSRKYVTKIADIATSIVEIAFFKKICNKKNTFFPYLYDMYINNKNIHIIMSYCGMTLHDKAFNLSFSERIGYLPQLFEQMINILTWFDSNNLIHMDIKPSNICWGLHDEPYLKIIDFGFVSYANDIKKHHIGTHVFADPSYHKYRNHETSYDVFSTGLTLICWLTKAHLNEKNIISLGLDDDLKLLDMIPTSLIYEHPNINREIFTSILQMIKLDEKKRFNIYDYNLHQELIDMTKHTPDIEDIENLKINKDNTSSIEDHNIIENIKKCLNKNYFLYEFSYLNYGEEIDDIIEYIKKINFEIW